MKAKGKEEKVWIKDSERERDQESLRDIVKQTR